jgi:hypothetical protein
MVTTSACWMLQAAVATRDTVPVQIVAQHATWFQAMNGVASFLAALMLVAVGTVFIVIVYRMRQTNRRVHQLMDRVNTEVLPLVATLRGVAGHAERIANTAQHEAEEFGSEIRRVRMGIHDALSAAERRLLELDAVLRVAQDELEETFISAASTLRGLRTGAAAMRDEALGPRSRAQRRRAELDAYDEIDDDELFEDVDDEEVSDGDAFEEPARSKPRIKRMGEPRG